MNQGKSKTQRGRTKTQATMNTRAKNFAYANVLNSTAELVWMPPENGGTEAAPLS
jgi:hypothetical protein